MGYVEVFEHYTSKGRTRDSETYSDTEETMGHSKLHSVPEVRLLSRYKILSHQAGMRFFSPES